MKKTFYQTISMLLLSLCLIITFSSPLLGKTIIDAVGRQVRVKEKSLRLVTTFKPATLCVLSLGLADRLVGVDSTSRRDKLQNAIHPPIKDLADIGRKMTGVNFETILSLKPDLVVMYAQKDGVKVANRLVKTGIPAIVILPESFKSLNDTLKLIADSVGEPSVAEKSMKASKRILKLAQERVQGIPANQKKSVYFASALGFFNTASGTMLMNDIVESAGGIMVSRDLKGYFKEISPETFIKWNPDLITVNSRSKALAVETLNRPEYGSVSAVAQNQVYAFPSNLAPWDFPSPITVLSVLWMGQKLYPERFSDVNLMGEIDRFHEALFGKSFRELDGKIADQIR